MTLAFDHLVVQLRTELATIDAQRAVLVEAITLLERGSGTVALTPARTDTEPKSSAPTFKTGRPNPTRPAKPTRRRPGPGTTYTLDQVAALATEAWTRGEPVESYVAGGLNITVSAAKNAMTRARQKGILGPRPTGTTDPIERTPFDPEQARMAAAEAL